MIIKENILKKIIQEEINKATFIKKKKINEKYNWDMTSYTHFAIYKPLKKIVFEWDYSDYDNSELKQFKRDYFYEDLVDNGINPKSCLIWTRKNCIRNGIDPENESNYINSGDINDNDMYERGENEIYYGDK